MRAIKLWSVAILLVIVVFGGASGPPVSAQTPRRRVLYINSYHRGYKFSDELTLGIESVLKTPEANVDVQVEYMDTKRIDSEAYLEQLYQTYKVKFADKRFDLILSSDDAALNFLFKHADDLFPDTPVVFSGANYFDVTRLEGRPRFTGVSEVADIQGTLDIALQLHPGTQQVFIVNDTTTTGQRVRERLVQLESQYPEIEFVYLENLPMVEVQRRLSRLAPGSLVLLTIFSRDSAGVFFEYDEFTLAVAQSSAVPVYATWDFSLGFGVVGGKLTSGFVEGERAARLALRVLQGERPQDIPVVQELAARYMFDYEQLQRWGISQSALPDDSVILNKPFSFYENYPELVWSVGISFVILGIVVTSLFVNVLRRRRTEVELRDRNQALQEIQTSLEARVAERTATIEQRAALLVSAAEVSRATTEIVDQEVLLARFVDLVRERFDLYYVGLFLADAGRQWAVLRAGTGEAGRQMLARAWRLEIGGNSMIGRCVATGRADIQLDVGEAAVRFENPFLPQTRSEMALPLRVRGEVIGAMTIQSEQASAFSEDDIRTMQTMADQMAAAISNARLFQQVQETLETERRAYGERTRVAWRDLAQSESGLGFLSDRRRTVGADAVWRSEMKAALRSGDIVRGDSDNVLAIPLKVRDQVVGVMDGRKPEGMAWTDEEIDLLSAMVEQLTVALEGAQLYRETRRRAAREQIVGELTGRIRESLEIERVLQTAARELGEALGAAQVNVRLVAGSGHDGGSQ